MADWFANVFGVEETAWDDMSRDLVANYDPRTGMLAIPLSRMSFRAGHFTTPSLKQLLTHRGVPKLKGFLPGRLVVSEVVDDASRLHTLPENRCATFQAASQFNTLEHVSEHGRPEQGITMYWRDKTQGPACAIACAAGTLVRNYIACRDRPDRQILNLDKVEQILASQEGYFQVRNGYTLATDASLEALNRRLAEPGVATKVMQALKVGVQWDTQVVASYFGARLHSDPKQIVTQVYCSAVSVAYSRCQPSLWEPFARLILRSLYRSTMHIAAINALRYPHQPGAKKVFLTAVGGGVFGNDMSWVKEAMHEALEAFRDVGLQVFLVSFERSTREFMELEQHFRPRRY